MRIASGGIFDPGASDHYVMTADMSEFAGSGSDEAAFQTVRSWTSDVWSHYRSAW